MALRKCKSEANIRWIKLNSIIKGMILNFKFIFIVHLRYVTVIFALIYERNFILTCKSTFNLSLRLVFLCLQQKN